MTDLYKNKDKMVKKYSFFSQIRDRPNQIETVPINQGEVAGTCTEKLINSLIHFFCYSSTPHVNNFGKLNLYHTILN